MPYCIMRFQKLKAASWGSLAGSLSHTLRSRYTPNADPELIKDNKIWLGPESTKEVVDLVRERWPEKYRKDAVGCIEYFIGASPEWFKKHGGEGDQDAYFQHAIDWLKAEYGEENVVSVVQHNDETSPHLAAYVVPVDEYGNLNAKKWTGGRAACARMQTRFHEAAGEPVGLERGIRGSKAEHMTIQQWYEQNATLDEQRREIKYDTFDLVAREAEVAEDLDEIASREKSLERREQRLGHQENDVTRRGYELDDREETLLKRESKASEMLEQAAAKLSGLADKEAEVTNRGYEVARLEREVAHKAESLSNRANVLDERENAVQRKSDALEREKAGLAERGRQLAALERELASRGEVLAGGEAALEKRQAAIDAAGEQLRQRLSEAKQLEARIEPLRADLSAREKENEVHHNNIVAAVKELEAWKAHRKDWEAKRDRWLAKHRPISLNAVQELSLDLAALSDDERITQMRALFSNDRPMADAVDRLNWVTYEDGSVTPEGRKALVEHGSLQEHVRRETEWKRSGLDNGPSGP